MKQGDDLDNCAILFIVLIAQENHEAILTEKEMEIEMLKDHIEVLLDEQEMANKSHQTEGKT